MTDKIEPEQLLLPLHFTPVFSFDNFELCSGNREAYQLTRRLCHEVKPGVLCIYGAKASGKTHLSQALCACTHHIKGEQAVTYYAFREHSPEKIRQIILQGQETLSTLLILEDVDQLHTFEGAEDIAFELFNQFQRLEKQIVITSRVHPQKLNQIHERLQSRFCSGLIIKIGLLDETICIEILKKVARDHQVTLPDKVIQYIIKRVPRNPAYLRVLFHRIDDYSLRVQKPITIPLVKKVFLMRDSSDD